MRCRNGLAIFALGALGTIALGSSARADLVIDQQQNDAETFIASFSMTGLAQSFQQSLGNIAGAAVRLQPEEGTGTADVRIQLYDGLPNQNGNLLRSGTVNDATPGQLAMTTWSPFATNPGQTYFLIFSSSNSSFGLAGSAENPYSLGQSYGNDFAAFPQFDFAFQTFAETSSVPEPSSLLLAGLGALGLAFAAYRSRR